MTAKFDTIQEMVLAAFALHQKGFLDQAEASYREVLRKSPTNFAALQLLGVLLGQQGKKSEAITILEAALKIQPKDFGVQSNYGIALEAVGRHQDALKAYQNAIAINRRFFPAYYNQGITLATLQKFEEAVTSFDKALALKPDSVQCLYNKGIALTSLGRLELAVDSYTKALAIDPLFVDALRNRGNVLRDLKRFDEALQCYNDVIAINPSDFRDLYNRGIALSDLNRFDEAIASFDTSIGINPTFPDAWFNRGQSLMAQNGFAEAIASFERGLALEPTNAKALRDKALALSRLDRLDESLAAYSQALAYNPNDTDTLLIRGLLLRDTMRHAAALADFDRIIEITSDHALAWNARGAVLHAMHRNQEASESFDRALNIQPDMAEALTNRAHLRWTDNKDYNGALIDLTKSLAVDPHQPYAQGELFHMKMQVADWSGFDSAAALINAGVREGRRIVRPFVYQALSTSPSDLQKCSRIFASHLFPGKVSGLLGKMHKHKKIKIGYMSGEFREHATSELMAGLYEQHDRNNFEIVAIDNGGRDNSAMRRRLEAAFDCFINISTLSDDAAADKIRFAEIDILVNLNGYFGSPRMGVFARRPAPIQVNYLGFPATLGATYMDYIIADKIVIPEEELHLYDEKVVWLPHSYQANDRKRKISDQMPSRSALGIPEEAFVFCNFNQSYKLTPEVFASWMRILEGTKGSVLWLMESNSLFAENLSHRAADFGIARERLIFAPMIFPDQHLARLAQADLFLDSFPYNAHTTASDALWAGLPLVTSRGTAFPGRVATSLLHAVGLPELVAGNMEEYEALAIKLALDRSFYGTIRSRLQDNRLRCPLFQTDEFRRGIEAAFVEMWELAQKGEAARAFNIGLPDMINRHHPSSI